MNDDRILDRAETPVIVECKQGAPTVENVHQLRHYMRLLGRETRKRTRGILVHGGARKLTREVERAAAEKPRIEIVQYRFAGGLCAERVRGVAGARG